MKRLLISQGAVSTGKEERPVVDSAATTTTHMGARRVGGVDRLGVTATVVFIPSSTRGGRGVHRPIGPTCMVDREVRASGPDVLVVLAIAR